MRRLRSRGSAYIPIIIAAVLVVVIVIGVFLFLNRNHSATKSSSQSAVTRNACVGQDFADGSSGHCVRDVQTLVNYMEHSGLTECPFSGGATLTVSGTYDSATATQVKSVQQWSSCYAKQEGFNSNVQQTGEVDKTTWGELCTYAYTDPLHTSANGAASSIAAGKDAGCAQLQS
jgi:hypothetical protein